MNNFNEWWRQEGIYECDDHDAAEAAWYHQENKIEELEVRIKELEEGLKLLPKIEPQDRDRFISRLINYGSIKQVMSD